MKSCEQDTMPLNQPDKPVHCHCFLLQHTDHLQAIITEPPETGKQN